ncbi:unnamed protein product [Effrenium voratum]|uniref:Uncharacterized protein n=1 Tax=Effrenium voratum TaxID=2562239 RepID=A0AA36HNC4_9DINO|nr:unnamed protein product [Effrenium voratum]
MARSILWCCLLFLADAAQLDATLSRKKGGEPYLMRPAEGRTQIHTVKIDFSKAPPPFAVDQTLAQPPHADGDPYSHPVWVSGESEVLGQPAAPAAPAVSAQAAPAAAAPAAAAPAAAAPAAAAPAPAAAAPAAAAALDQRGASATSR